MIRLYHPLFYHLQGVQGPAWTLQRKRGDMSADGAPATPPTGGLCWLDDAAPPDNDYDLVANSLLLLFCFANASPSSGVFCGFSNRHHCLPDLASNHSIVAPPAFLILNLDRACGRIRPRKHPNLPSYPDVPLPYLLLAVERIDCAAVPTVLAVARHCSVPLHPCTSSHTIARRADQLVGSQERLHHKLHHRPRLNPLAIWPSVNPNTARKLHDSCRSPNRRNRSSVSLSRHPRASAPSKSLRNGCSSRPPPHPPPQRHIPHLPNGRVARLSYHD